MCSLFFECVVLAGFSEMQARNLSAKEKVTMRVYVSPTRSRDLACKLICSNLVAARKRHCRNRAINNGTHLSMRDGARKN
jgi:hypothetical protein